jgi:Fur family ferric uptake transcriptional regulator
MTDPEQLLRQNNIRITALRVGVLYVLIQSLKAHTSADLETMLTGYSKRLRTDRVSLYRTLMTLTEASLVKKFIDSRGCCSYFCELSAPETGQVHFKCSQCKTIIPRPALPEPYLDTVRQYQINSIHLLAEGTCNDCQQAQPNSPAYP